MMISKSDPTWLPLLNALQLEWRDRECMAGRDPDSVIEQDLIRQQRWPIASHPTRTALRLAIMVREGR